MTFHFNSTEMLPRGSQGSEYNLGKKVKFFRGKDSRIEGGENKSEAK